MIVMFVNEFKKVADKDPFVKEMVEASERMAFLSQLGRDL
jgi:hypothetical protein